MSRDRRRGHRPASPDRAVDCTSRNRGGRLRGRGRVRDLVAPSGVSWGSCSGGGRRRPGTARLCSFARRGRHPAGVLSGSRWQPPAHRRQARRRAVLRKFRRPAGLAAQAASPRRDPRDAARDSEPDPHRHGGGECCRQRCACHRSVRQLCRPVFRSHCIRRRPSHLRAIRMGALGGQRDRRRSGHTQSAHRLRHACNPELRRRQRSRVHSLHNAPPHTVAAAPPWATAIGGARPRRGDRRRRRAHPFARCRRWAGLRSSLGSGHAPQPAPRAHSTLYDCRGLHRRGRLEGIVAVSNVDHRFDAWRSALLLIESHPLIGVGPGNFQLYTAIVDNRPPTPDDPTVVHNAYLEVGAEIGLPAFALLVAYVVTSWKRLRSVMQQRVGPPSFAIAVTASMIVAVMAALTLSEQYSAPLWVMGAIATCLWQEAKTRLGGAPVDAAP
ncbi:MAG: O-antigen ligase family protein [Chloroflexi bacterium]|nr:MAG: O-antigen ligase family protein [Chloroflexota bacterium]